MSAKQSVKQAMILAAGRGSRLSPITDTTPKALVPFLGRPLLEHAAAHLVNAGVERIAVNVHHLGAQVAQHVEEVLAPRHSHVEWHVAYEDELLGTGGALSNLRDWFDDGPFFVVNADAVFDADLLELAASRQHSGADAVWMTTREPLYAALRVVSTTAEGELNAIAPEALEDGTTFCGVHVATQGLLDTLPKGASCVVRDGYLPWIKRGAKVGTWETKGFWADTGTPARYIDAHQRGLELVERWRSLGLLESAC
mgnify:CR=1 FL=1